MRLVGSTLAAVLCAACADTGHGGTDTFATEATSAANPTDEAEGPSRLPAPVRQGGALARGARDEALYVADEDHAMLRVVPLPLGSAATASIDLPGRPAQVLARGDGLLVTIRDPGMLLSLARDERGAWAVRRRVALPADAWGIALTDDERTAVVTSAWTHRVSAVDLATGAVRWSLDVGREPRGVAIMAGGERAYVTHLAGSDVTRIDGVSGEAPSATRVKLPAGRFTAPVGAGAGIPDLDASLAYAPVLSPDGKRLFVPRHAIGGVGWAPWFGRPVVDVLLTGDDSALAPARDHAGRADADHQRDGRTLADGEAPVLPLLFTVQPRAAVYRASAGTLLVASEGHGRLTELDARALDPSLHSTYRYELIHGGGEAARCGAPTGVALSADEDIAYVFCRTTGEIARVPLKPASFARGPDAEPDAPEYLRIAPEPLSGAAAIGRRLFYDARNDDDRNAGVSGGLACAGCHPDGRDDGHVWREEESGALLGTGRGAPRRTPILAGRVSPEGPYGWHGDEPTLEARILTGFAIHRWGGKRGMLRYPDYVKRHTPQAAALAAFLRGGLVPPPRERRALSTEEERGKALFESEEAGCASCHDPARGYSDRSLAPLALGPSAVGSDHPDGAPFRVPSLLHVGGAGALFHDGRFRSIGELVGGVGDGMGRTSSLSGEDRAALAAYVATIGAVTGEATDDATWPLDPDAPLPVGRIVASEPAKPPPDLSTFAASPPAAAESPEPSRAEWDAAAETRFPHMPEDCHARRVREWARIQCLPRRDPVMRVSLVAGDPRGVSLRIEHRTGPDAEGVVVFPVRRGDRRLFTVNRFVLTGLQCSKYPEWMEATTFTISESWLPGEPAPDIVVTRYGRHPSTGALRIQEHCP